jgi:hypothetical protein
MRYTPGGLDAPSYARHVFVGMWESIRQARVELIVAWVFRVEEGSQRSKASVAE